MNLFISKTISSIMQIILFAIIPFIWWFVTVRKQQKFSQWIGIKKITGGKKTLFAIGMVSVAFLSIGIFTLYIIRDVETATSDFTGLGARAIPAIIIYAAFNTAFPEELLFRGFLLKRLTNKFGFCMANLIQALLFGVFHGVMFISFAGSIRTILVIVLTGTIAWSIGFINEKYSDGSILPSWIIHTISNLFSGICSAFLIV